MGLPRDTLTYGQGTRHPEGGKRDLQGGGGFGSTLEEDDVEDDVDESSGGERSPACPAYTP